MTIEAYQAAAAMQSRVVQVRRRPQIKENVARAIVLFKEVA